MYKVEKFEGELPKEVDHMGHHKLPEEGDKTGDDAVEDVAEEFDPGDPGAEPEAEDSKPRKSGKKKSASGEA